MLDRYHGYSYLFQMVQRSKSPRTKVPSFLSYSMSHSFFSLLFQVLNIDVLLDARFFDWTTSGNLIYFISFAYYPCSFSYSFIRTPKLFLSACSCPYGYSLSSKNKLLLFWVSNYDWLLFINDAWLSLVVFFSLGELFF